MLSRLPRRKRLVVLTAAATTAVVASATAALVLAARDGGVYRPGEAVAGLTATLARTLPPDHPRVTFTDVTAQAGIAFRHFSGTRSSQLPEDMGSGAAWGDYNRDGWPDLYVVNSAGPITLSPAAIAASPARSALYRNDGDGTFTDVTDEAGVAFRGLGMGAAWGDADNDGWPDLFVTVYGENVFYRNNGDGSFSERTSAAGLGGYRGFWTGAAWGDYDRDGHLDLYVTGYVQVRLLPDTAVTLHYDIEEPASINPSTFPPERNLLYHNDGNGTFREVASAAGVANPEGKGLAAAWADFDADGWLDLYVANDVSDNVLYRNRGDGTFADLSHAAHVADYRGAMGIAVGDWDGDLDLDMVITHWIAQENALYVNRLSELHALRGAPARPPLQFMDEADRYGLGQIALDYIGWGTAFLDYDNDGRLDLFVVNGSTFQQRDQPQLLVPMVDQLFWNRSNEEGFFDVSAVSGAYFQRPLVGRGAAFADYDGDGDVDAFIVNNGGPAVLLRNEDGNSRPWLEVAVEGRHCNRSGIGTTLRLVAGGRSQIRQVGAQPSYLSQNSLVEHFGLGTAALVDTLEIVWPAGERQVLTGVGRNQRVHVVEGQGAR
jgi:hypothetical protein